jgi:hypothetical protein
MGDHFRQGGSNVLLIHQGDTPIPRDPDAWAGLSEEEQQAVYRDYIERRLAELVATAGPDS